MKFLEQLKGEGLNYETLLQQTSRRECQKSLALKRPVRLILAPNLTILSIMVCESMIEIVIAATWGQASDVENLNPFAKLAVLVLKHLPQLGSIYQKALLFPRLWKIHVF